MMKTPLTVQITSADSGRCHFDQCIIGMFKLWKRKFFNCDLEGFCTTPSVLVLTLDPHPRASEVGKGERIINTLIDHSFHSLSLRHGDWPSLLLLILELAFLFNGFSSFQIKYNQILIEWYRIRTGKRNSLVLSFIQTRITPFSYLLSSPF